MDTTSDRRARLMRELGVSATELDDLVGDDARKTEALDALSELLARKLRPGRLPAAVRTPAAALGGRTVLEVVRDGGHEQALAAARESFAWDSSA